MNIFDQNYPQYRYADDKASKSNETLSPELKYVLHLEKMFSDNVSFSCIYCTLLANFLISVAKDIIKKDKHIVEGLKELVIKYFTQLKESTLILSLVFHLPFCKFLNRVLKLAPKISAYFSFLEKVSTKALT